MEETNVNSNRPANLNSNVDNGFPNSIPPATAAHAMEADSLVDCRTAGLENDIKLLKEENASLVKLVEGQNILIASLVGKVNELEDFFNYMKDKHGSCNTSATVQEKQADNPSVDDKEQKQANFEAQLSTVVTDVIGINKKIGIYGSHLTDISKVVYKLEAEVQKFIRRHSLVIENLCPKEDSSAMEMLLIFAKSVLNVTLEEFDIESLHIIEKPSVEPVPSTPEKRILPRPVLVTFTCYKMQAQIYKSWLSFRSRNIPGSLSKERGQGITIKEYLTENQENIYDKALKLKEKHLVVDCWTYKGKTYIKKLNGTYSEFSDSTEIVPKAESSSCIVM